MTLREIEISALTHADTSVAAILQFARCNDWLECALYKDMPAACDIAAREYARDYSAGTGNIADSATVYMLAHHMRRHCVAYLPHLS